MSPTEDEVLRHGELTVEGRLREASNTTLLAVATLDGVSIPCVYKPRRGERPLWDFPSGTLGYREVAAYALAQRLGWGLIPTTLWRDDAPLGPGMCQSWVHAGDVAPVDVIPTEQVPPGWKIVAEGDSYDGAAVSLAHEDAADLRRLALFDILANNTDRKGGHVLRTEEGQLYGIDHGLTFHEDDKLRTVLWGWAGSRLAADERDELSVLRGHLGETADDAVEAVADLGRLSGAEVRALLVRLETLCRAGRFPDSRGAWPALPWPAM